MFGPNVKSVIVPCFAQLDAVEVGSRVNTQNLLTDLLSKVGPVCEQTDGIGLLHVKHILYKRKNARKHAAQAYRGVAL